MGLGLTNGNSGTLSFGHKRKLDFRIKRSAPATYGIFIRIQSLQDTSKSDSEQEKTT